MKLTDTVDKINNVGKQRLEKLHKLNIFTVKDLIMHYPREYEDRSKVKSIEELIVDEVNTFKYTIQEPPVVQKIGSKTLVKIVIKEDLLTLELVWFNQPYLKSVFTKGKTFLFTTLIKRNGYKLQGERIVYELFNEKELLSTGRIVPIYPSTAKLSQKLLRGLIKATLDEIDEEIKENLPAKLLEKYELCNINYAVKNIHFPENDKAFFMARKRLVFEELFILQLALYKIKGDLKRKSDIFISNNNNKEIIEKIPFTLTNAQQNVIDEAEKDMKSGFIMNRLIQGDVGSGKTVVAAVLAYNAIKNGYQVALMAPTEVLATQHIETFTELFKGLGVNITLLAGALKAKEKREAKNKIETGISQMIIGTHALIQEGVNFHNLGFVITDEQHRFGVKQRISLSDKGTSPHTLVMTATPIPRTLALILYGDLDISIIDELPPNRMSIKTNAVTTAYYERLYTFIKKEINEGRQAYVICPMIDEVVKDETEDTKETKEVKEPEKYEKKPLKSVITYAETLKEVFKDYTVAYLHGKMKQELKQEIMTKFANGETDILISTTVIEVGINVPNATVMLIENAERFGLSQLHQLRGRVGRGKHQSYCVLVTDSKNQVTKKRMKAMVDSNDGFYISELDLELRGSGDFFGTRQHGLPDMKIANLYKDMDALKIVQKCAEEVYSRELVLSKEEEKALYKDVEIRFKLGIVM